MSTRGLYVLVKVLSVNRNYAFPCCIKCSTRIRTEDDENIFICSKCQQKYDKKQIIYRYRINMTVSDRTQVSNVTVFGQCLEHFFGTSATHLKRFVEGLCVQKVELPLPVDQLVQQCIEQCFVGSMIRLCFRGLNPCQTESQASRSSPTHLNNILRKMQEVKMNYLPGHQKNSSHLLASYMSRPEGTEKNATVIELLKEYLEFFRSSKSMTPSFHLTSGPHSMDCLVPQHNMSLQSNSSRLHYPDLQGRKVSEDFHLMVSPLVLSREAGGSSKSPATELLNRGVDSPMHIDSKLKSQSRMQISPMLNNSPNKTALMLVGLLNVDTSKHCNDDSSSDLTNDTDIIHDKPRSTCTENLAYHSTQSIIEKPVNVQNATDNEKQSSCSCLEEDHRVNIDQGDMDLYLDEDLSSFFGNISLESGWERYEATSENSKSRIYEQRLEDSHEFQNHLPSECNSLQGGTEQISISFPEDMLTDLEFSNFSLLYEYEPRPSTSKPSPMTSSQDNMRTDNKVLSCAMDSSNVQRANSYGKNSLNEAHNEIPETSGDNSCHNDSFCCYSSTDKPTRQERVDSPAQLSFESLIDQTSTPVLFDDLSHSSGSRLKLYRSLSLPEALQPADVMERDINLNMHSTPLHSQCQRKFMDLSGDLQNYSGSFVHNGKKYISTGQNVSLNAKAPNKDGVSHVFSSARSRMEEAIERGENKDPNFVESFSLSNEMSPLETGRDRWRTSDQICPQSPLLFSFSSSEGNSCKMTPDIQEDSLLCASLLECSYLK